MQNYVFSIADKNKGRRVQIVRAPDDLKVREQELAHLRERLKPEYSIVAVPISETIGPHLLKGER